MLNKTGGIATISGGFTIFEIKVPDFGVVNISRDMKIRCFGSTLSFWKEVKGGAVLKTRYRGSLESMLNNTAAFIYVDIRTNHLMEIGEIVNHVSLKYDLVETPDLWKDIMACIYSLWKLVLVEWVDNNPFRELIKSDDGFIGNLTHDDLRQVVALARRQTAFIDPSIGFRHTRSEFINLILSGSSHLVGYFNSNHQIVSLIITTKSEYSNVLYYTGSVPILKKLFDYIAMGSITNCFVLQTNDFSLKNTIENIGFQMCGILKKELDSGDVDVYVL